MTKGHWAAILAGIGSIGSLLSGNVSFTDPHILTGIAGTVLSIVTALNSPALGDSLDGSDKSIARKP